MKIPKGQPIGEDYKNGVDHSEREQSGKFYAITRDDQFSDAREQVRQRQSVNEREKRGDMFKRCHRSLKERLLFIAYRPTYSLSISSCWNTCVVI